MHLFKLFTVGCCLMACGSLWAQEAGPVSLPSGQEIGVPAPDRAALDRVVGAIQNVAAQIKYHNANPPDPRNQAAVNAYNAEASRLNAELQRLQGELRRLLNQ